MGDLLGGGRRGARREAVREALIESVFWPNSPLHDLALVIRGGGRVWGAACSLPLAEGAELARRRSARVTVPRWA
jgi:DNA integrity scanning protein DisA with diadenylate cyclase activity